MEAIGQLLKQINLPNPKTSIRNTIEFGAVKKYARQLGIADEADIEKHFIILNQAREGEETCARCRGFNTCPLNPPGFKQKIRIDLYPALVLQQCDQALKNQEEKRINRLLVSARIPGYLRSKTFDNFVQTDDNREAYLESQKVAQDMHGKGLLLSGNTGTGKTHLAMAILNERIKQGYEGLFCTVPELLADIKRTFGKETDTSELIELVKNTDLLLLDDLGAEKSTDWVLEQMFVIINARLIHWKQTVVTTNFTSAKTLINKLEGLPGQRIVSRLFEMCTVKALKGEDWRMKL